ncbi:flagellar hook-length control protein FliK [Thiomicrorhabdus sp.]|uniref:flagellar hook-length control protein FliK n=1 Tax=Thiomicrorhabdus sp. TaxID=2039724 RepID=UPI0029C912E0|nr:flagellar hook-length control protein FliK [Thiomicrorhabdus sp.]
MSEQSMGSILPDFSTKSTIKSALPEMDFASGSNTEAAALSFSQVLQNLDAATTSLSPAEIPKNSVFTRDPLTGNSLSNGIEASILSLPMAPNQIEDESLPESGIGFKLDRAFSQSMPETPDQFSSGRVETLRSEDLPAILGSETPVTIDVRKMPEFAVAGINLPISGKSFANIVDDKTLAEPDSTTMASAANILAEEADRGLPQNKQFTPLLEQNLVSLDDQSGLASTVNSLLITDPDSEIAGYDEVLLEDSDVLNGVFQAVISQSAVNPEGDPSVGNTELVSQPLQRDVVLQDVENPDAIDSIINPQAAAAAMQTSREVLPDSELQNQVGLVGAGVSNTLTTALGEHSKKPVTSLGYTGLAFGDKTTPSWSHHVSSSTTPAHTPAFSAMAQQATTQQNMQFAQMMQESLIQNDADLVDEKSTMLKELGLAESSTDRRSTTQMNLPQITAGVKHPQWGQQFTQRVVVMVNQQVQQAQIALNPEQLGPMKIRLQFDKDQQLQISVSAQHGMTRDAVENALPRLREVLAQSGIDLGSVDIRDDSPSENKNNQAQDAYTALVSADSAEEMVSGPVNRVTLNLSKNLVDYYA